MRFVPLSFAVTATLLTSFHAAPLRAQGSDTSFTERGPRFLLATATRGRSTRPPVRVDVARTPVLRRRITLDMRDVSVHDALTRIARESGLQLMYSDALLPELRAVTLRAQDITVAAALTEVLLDADIDILFSPSGQVALIRRAAERRALAGIITGRVTDAASGSPIPLAQVSVAGTSLARTTDDDGRFTITGVPAGAHTITVRRLGYDPRSRDVLVADGATVTADVTLTGAATRLAEIVSTATGGQRRVELGHTVGLVNADSIVREAPVTNFVDVLTARIPGVMVNFQAGYAGITSPIRIRGLNSFTLANDPLIIIDGARVEATSSTFGFDQYGVKSSRLGDINPDEIESIEVVKGPSAATLYGTDAANGVIVIRTKRGTAGPARWSAYAEGGLVAPPANNFPTNYYGWGHSPAGAVVGCTVSLQASGGCVLDSLTSFNLLKNDAWTPFGNGNRSQLGLQVAGGNAAFKYFASGEVERELGFIKMSDNDQRLVSAQRAGAAIPYEQKRPNALRRVSLRGNVTANLSERSDLTFSNSLMLGTFRTPNSGTIYQATVFSNGARLGIGTAPSSVANSFSRRNRDDVVRYINSLAYNWRALDWLATRATVGLDYSATASDQLVKSGEGNSPLGARNLQQNNIGQYTVDLGATATRGITQALVSKTSTGVQYSRRTNSITATSATGLPPGSETVTGGATITGSESKADAVVAGAYVEQQLAWRDRLFATAALRADGSSTFGRNLNTTVYPKFGLSWLLSEDPIIPKIPGVGSLRVRTAFGASGQQPPSTAAIPLVTLSNAVINNVSVSAVTLNTPGNPDVKPERTQEFEVGLDAEGKGGRIRAELTYYSRKSSDALVSLAFPVSAGGGSRFVNIGSVTNKGLEALLTLDVVNRPSLGFNLTLNGSTNANKLVSRDPASDALPPAPNVLQSTLVTGYPIYGLWQRPILGFADANNNGFIEPSEVQVGATPVYLGAANPTKQLSVIPSLTLFNGLISASALFDWRGGYKRMHFGEWGRCTILVVCREAFDPNTPLDIQAKIVANNATTSTYGFTYDASFTKLRELSVTLRAPTRFARALRSSGASLVLSGRNLALWTDYPDDPEVNGTLSSEQIQTQNTMPSGRYWIARLNLAY